MPTASQLEEPSILARILVVDDDTTFRRYAERVLVAAGYECVLAEGTQQARAALATQRFDLLLTDIQLADGDGLDLLRYVSEHRASLPVVLVTGFPTVSTAVDALRLEATDYVTKPAADLEVYVARALRRHVRQRNERNDAGARISWSRRLRELADYLERGSGDGEPPAPLDANMDGGLGVGGDTGGEREAAGEIWDLLSPREADVARYLLDGQGPPHISEALGISVNTVRNHLQSAFRKTGARSQVELVAKLSRPRG